MTGRWWHSSKIGNKENQGSSFVFWSLIVNIPTWNLIAVYAGQVSSPIYLLYVLSCPDMLWLTGDFLYWCLVVCSSFVCTTVVSTTCVCTVQSLLMCTKLHCTTELVIFSAAVVCGGWWAAESVAMAMHCTRSDVWWFWMYQMWISAIVPFYGLPRDAFSKNDTVTVL